MVGLQPGEEVGADKFPVGYQAVNLVAANQGRVNMRFVNIGSRLEALCDNLGEFENRRHKITADEGAGVQLEIATAPARVRIASSVWENDGFGLEDLTERLSS